MLIAETRREYTRDSLASCEQQYKGNNIVDYEKLPNVSELRAASFKLREDTFVTTVCVFFSRKNTNKHIQTYRSSSLSSVENTPSGKCSMAFEDKSLKQINQYW